MTTEPTADMLRAMAEHRGLKLVRSRKRTPGTGDYGKFGLTDASGKPLLGMGNEGLTATAAEVEQFLRGGIMRNWKLSAETAADGVPAKRKKAPAGEQMKGPAPRKRTGPRKEAPLPPPARRKQNPPPPPRAKPVLRVIRDPERHPEPEPKLRSATKKDAAAIGRMLAQLADRPDPDQVLRNFAAISGAKAGVIVAEEAGGLTGCCAWAAVPTLQRGLVGRITLLLVDKNERRRGIATALLAAVNKKLAKAGCATAEAMSDIMIANAHNFFRARGFEQKSYRFVRAVEARAGGPQGPGTGRVIDDR